MEFISVIAAAAAAFVLGAGYYGALAKPWVEAAGVECDEDGKPKGGQSPMIFAMAFLLQLIVVGMMRHVFTLSGIETLGAGLIGGAGVGLFFISPWIALNNMYGMRPVKLTLIDGGYATLACAIAGLVLSLF
ncbi:DUF1761 domain-containing protein [Leisingera sp. HS039]|uniref:DUF1761 domain-containing protein n=1 Tax=unclassified Leisingera TaxID=2614906 RepID=UPI001070EAB1|nr:MULTISPECIES: DUF1761 domain-containing protein [unclassified Leisingera]MBQ4823204.1 DUF1761 domain-containing protein [Leisingera sp. HS039]QBR38045.1 DUF1761 domain-containing protein [Leisingera sp. NJS201]